MPLRFCRIPGEAVSVLPEPLEVVKARVLNGPVRCLSQFNSFELTSPQSLALR